MKLNNKKTLAIKTLKIGKERIVFLQSTLNEIKEAITKQDIRDLVGEGAILVKNIKGRKKIEKKKKNKGPGKIRKKVNKRKKEYVIMTRKLRKYVAEMKKQGKLPREDVLDIRKKIRNKAFKSKANLRDYIGRLNK
ncbi:hypothetical protein KAJ87_03615 [Candidatus Pacearchaeota archaeon]|nr:hypothetical protein [Candidatus Pacearchaeota archaeon]